MLIGAEIEKKSYIWDSCSSVHYNANLCDPKDKYMRYKLKYTRYRLKKTNYKYQNCNQRNISKIKYVKICDGLIINYNILAYNTISLKKIFS